MPINLDIASKLLRTLKKHQLHIIFRDRRRGDSYTGFNLSIEKLVNCSKSWNISDALEIILKIQGKKCNRSLFFKRMRTMIRGWFVGGQQKTVILMRNSLLRSRCRQFGITPIYFVPLAKKQRYTK